MAIITNLITNYINLIQMEIQQFLFLHAQSDNDEF